MSNITIEVQFLAGTDIRDAITEAKQKALQWGVEYVKFDFNGIRCSISQRADVEELVIQWHGLIKSERKYLVG